MVEDGSEPVRGSVMKNAERIRFWPFRFSRRLPRRFGSRLLGWRSGLLFAFQVLFVKVSSARITLALLKLLRRLGALYGCPISGARFLSTRFSCHPYRGEGIRGFPRYITCPLPLATLLACTPRRSLGRTVS